MAHLLVVVRAGVIAHRASAPSAFTHARFTLGANVLVEKVFAWPGIGSYAVEALVVSDYAAVQGFVLAMAVLFVLLNLAIDVLYTVIDPRTRGA